MRKRKKYKTGIATWPEEDRPREKLLKFGEHTLTTSELLGVLLRSGIKGESAVDLGRKIIKKFKTLRQMSHTDISQWREIKGLGEAKICQIKAAIELGRRFMIEEKKTKGKVESSKEVANLFMPRMRDLKKEIFKILLLDGQNNIMDINGVEIDEGTVTQVSPNVREIMSKALQNFAAGIVCIHNHPSGIPSPSQEDKRFTERLVTAGRSMQIKVLDHVIIGDNKYFSFADEGLIDE
jgi:DNA repair protein RadC